MTSFAFLLRSCVIAVIFGGGTSAWADKFSHPTAVFKGLDKVTGRILTFDVAIHETVQFGTLQITPRACYTRPQTEKPEVNAFVEVDEVDPTAKHHRIFSGWMFAGSPGLHGVEHPVYDLWLGDCKGTPKLILTPSQAPVSAPPANDPSAPPFSPAPSAPPPKEEFKPSPRRLPPPVEPPAEKNLLEIDPLY